MAGDADVLRRPSLRLGAARGGFHRLPTHAVDTLRLVAIGQAGAMADVDLRTFKESRGMSKFAKGTWVKHVERGVARVLHNRKLSRMLLVRFLNGSALNDYRHRF